jgi:molybdopterin-containing oxidoreductase family iron-sulfur binding subunit
MSDEARPGPAKALRARLENARGAEYWKSLDELSRTPEFREFLAREFPPGASEWPDGEGSRRDFLRLMGASLALAGLEAGCTRQPTETIVPYVRKPEDVVPGRALYFATSLYDQGYAKGVLVESHEGRPTKIEGNPEHPSSLGGTDVFMQAAILELYDPDRSQTVVNLGDIRAWGSFIAAMRTAMEAQRPLKGAGFRLLTETVTSPSLAKQIEDLLAEFPQGKWHQWDPLARDSARQGAILAFGQPVETRYNLAAADVIVSLDADFIGSGPGRLAATREYARRRKVTGEHATLNRLYVVESTPSLSGSVADHRWPLKPSEIEPFARALAAALGLPVETSGLGDFHVKRAAAVAQDLLKHSGAALVIAGDSQPPAVHALAHAMNAKLEGPGKTVVYTAPVAARSLDHLESLKELARDLESGQVSLLLILGGNPVYTAPPDLRFAEVMDRAAIRVHSSFRVDETSEHCHWHLPAAHSLESWGDARAHDGTVGMLQPLIAPLYGGKSPHEVLAAFSSRPERTGYEIVREYWRGRLGGAAGAPAPRPARPGAGAAAAAPAAAAADVAFEKAWQRALHDGIVAGSALPPLSVTARLGDWATAPAPTAASGVEVVFRPDPCVGDGRFANNGWLQELPKPLTKLTWENAVLLGWDTAQRLGIRTDATSRGTFADIVELKLGDAAVTAPALVVPAHPEGCATLHLGYGRSRAGRVGNGLGFNAYLLRTSGAMWSAAGASLRKTGARVPLGITQDHWTILHEPDAEAQARHLVRSVTLLDYNRDPHAIGKLAHDPPPTLSLYPGFKYDGHAWGMAIDMNACVGCNACVVACVAENNIPVVGKEQVARGREMHWIRIDRYHRGDPARPDSIETYHQPLPCMQCENAPCEVVCPVAATTHSDEGLNDMVYNRCVGTRYCSNNCPYKVRRFNFFLYQDWTTPSLKLMRNPDVTVRSRGVMEKCTYCVQRINEARVEARNQGRDIRDGEIQTACQQACPAEAIVFGDINDPGSRVAQWKREPRNYGLLTDINTRPRTTYLGNVRNPNPELA